MNDIDTSDAVRTRLPEAERISAKNSTFVYNIKSEMTAEVNSKYIRDSRQLEVRSIGQRWETY